MLLKDIQKAKQDLLTVQPYLRMDDDTNAAICGEECSELAQECMKWVRYCKGDRSLRKGRDYILIDLNEEIADVLISITNLLDAGIATEEHIMENVRLKLERYEDVVNKIGGLFK